MGSEPDDIYDRMQRLQGIERVEEYLRWLKETYKDPNKQEWMETIVPHLTVISHSLASPYPRVTFRFTPQPGHSNGVTGVHGGCTASLFDHCTSMVLPLISRPGFWKFLGISRTLNVTYVRPMPVGEPVDVECEVVHAGRRLAALRGVARAAARGAEGQGPVLAICEHGKVNTDPPVGGKL
ncbi:HotDog domain-containing protein [Biscogniauxia marginata]|nr:HotDog domain-containing protein [Biscogniauxia marginata]